MSAGFKGDFFHISTTEIIEDKEALQRYVNNLSYLEPNEKVFVTSNLGKDIEVQKGAEGEK